ncbi:hypothetical protein M408DRAFT_30668 [Serendipita vermifera MAFF 305830]|uniref:Uncharacterized protein n=1 Tax=Serendipita vermifera MAFF 305830 TaxID=933852 RepID=A0A0C2W0R7_SERVB|nr:hypothetical protein M408DRAFT_30668 [Serendipita vermifera MAFF 305830]
MYGIKDVSKSKMEGVIVVDHQSLLYYDTDLNGGAPKHSENLLERIARSTNKKVLAIKEYVKTHIKTTIFGVIMFFMLTFYALKCCMDADLPTPNDYYVSGPEKKGRGRLD